jgi:polysaccharide chain length determinant protein (PEP-CTERM system associated)
MLPGKKYKPEDILSILRRRFWVLMLPFALVSAGVAVYVHELPDQYRAETLILVVPPRVPEAYVKSNVTTRIEDRLQSMSQQILSRTRLERIIQDLNLYEKERRTGIMQDIVEQMRKDINAEVMRGDAFRMSYVGADPRVAMKVTEALASLFVDENAKDRSALAEDTSKFLDAQLEDARSKLVEREQKLEAYRKQYSFELPSQLEPNMQAISNVQMQVQSLVESVNHDQERRLIIERQIADLEQTDPSDLAPPTSSASPSDNNLTASQQLTLAQAQLAALQQRLKPDHPDVQRMKRTVSDLRAKVEAEALKAPLSPESNAPATSSAEAARRRRVQELRNDLSEIDRQIAAKQREEERLRQLAGGYQRRVEAAPTREAELTSLTRDYTTLQTMYQSLLSKREESKIASNLESRQIGEQFKILDAARLPEKPFSPNRPRLNAIGFIGGLAIGLGLIALLEYRDSSFRTDDDVVRVLSLPVLAVVPVMRSTAERRRDLQLKVLLGFGLGTTVVACMAIVVYTLVR